MAFDQAQSPRLGQRTSPSDSGGVYVAVDVDSYPRAPYQGQQLWNATTESLLVYVGTVWKRVPKESVLRPVGEMTIWPSDEAPEGWLSCDGSEVDRVIYDELFAVIGESFGPGDGEQTFNLPDMRKRLPRGTGTSMPVYMTEGKDGDTLEPTRSIGHNHGVSITANNVGAAHTHGIPNQDAVGTPVSVAVDTGATDVNRESAFVGHDHQGDTNTSGSSHTHNVIGNTAGTTTADFPFLVLNFIIKV